MVVFAPKNKAPGDDVVQAPAIFGPNAHQESCAESEDGEKHSQNPLGSPAKCDALAVEIRHNQTERHFNRRGLRQNTFESRMRCQVFLSTGYIARISIGDYEVTETPSTLKITVGGLALADNATLVACNFSVDPVHCHS